MLERPELLGTNVLSRAGCCEQVEKYYLGWRTDLPGGEFVHGWRGQETKVVETVIRPIRTFMVVDAKEEQS
ncbi:MAG: hypothetical protein ACOX6N_03365 [Patescibacteria group bacterium]|jgi:hypothetical protein